MATTVKSVTGRKSSSTNKMRVRLAWESRASKPSSPCSTASLPNPITVSTHTPHLLTMAPANQTPPPQPSGRSCSSPSAPSRLLFFGGLGFVGFFGALLGVAWAATRASVSMPRILLSNGDAGRLAGSQSEIKTLCEERGLPKGRPAPRHCSDYFPLMHIRSKASTVSRIERTQVHCSRCSAHSLVTCAEIEAGAEPNFNGSPASVPGHVFFYQLGLVSHLE